MDGDNVHWLTVQDRPEMVWGEPCGILIIRGESETLKVGMTEQQITTLISALQALRGRVGGLRKELKN